MHLYGGKSFVCLQLEFEWYLWTKYFNINCHSVIGIEIETIASFNRMKQLCGDISLIVKAMKLCPAVEVRNHVQLDYSFPQPSC